MVPCFSGVAWSSLGPPTMVIVGAPNDYRAPTDRTDSDRSDNKTQLGGSGNLRAAARTRRNALGGMDSTFSTCGCVGAPGAAQNEGAPDGRMDLAWCHALLEQTRTSCEMGAVPGRSHSEKERRGAESDLFEFPLCFLCIGAGEDERGIELGRRLKVEGPRISVRLHPLHLLSHLSKDGERSVRDL
jgi:hypothetical protein